MNKLIIVGAGGFGREVLEWAWQNPDRGVAWDIAGFIDDDPVALKGFEVGCPILGTIKDWKPSPEELFVISIGDPKTKKNVVGSLSSKGAQFITLVHPSAIIARTASIGKGSVICPQSVVSANAKVGDYVMLNLNCAVGHDASIGDWCTLSSYCDITGKVKVGSGVFLGSHAIVVPNVQVGDNVIISAGSLVVTNVRDGSKVFGIPARKLNI